MITDKTLLKVTGTNATPCYGGIGQWHKPHSQKRPGKWMPLIKYIIPCKRGYHVCEGEQVLRWLGPELYEVEIRGRADKRGKDKIVAQQARLVKRIKTWNDRTVRLFACDCAKRVLRIFEDICPKDKRPAEAIKIARAFADGKATKEELVKACEAATNSAYTAVQSFSADAAYNAAYAAADTCNSDAFDAARHVSSAAAEATTDYAGEREWQWNRLKKYLNNKVGKS